MTELDRLNRLIQSKTLRKGDLTYTKTGLEHDPMFTCILKLEVAHTNVIIVVESESSSNKKLAYANAVKKFFVDYDDSRFSDDKLRYDIEVIIDLDNSADLLQILDHRSNNINAFASKQYSGPRPKHGSLTLAKSFVHDAADLLIAYRAGSIVSASSKNNVLLVSKDSAFDSLYRELSDDFGSKRVCFVTTKQELDAELANITKQKGETY